MKATFGINRVLKVLALVATGLAVTVFFTPTHHVKRVFGADHREAPTVDAIPEGDITDVYTFVDPNDSTRVDFIMNVNPFAEAAEGGSYAFSPSLLYQFKIDNTGDAKEDQVIQIAFNQPGQTQTASVYGPAVPATVGARNTLLTSAPTATGTFGNVFGSSSGVQAYVGLRDDPFVFDFAQFTRILNNTQDLFRQVGTSFRGRPVRADGTSGVDTFAGFNVTSIVVSVPISMIKGSGPTINVWATVSQQIPTRHGSSTYTQFERMGQQVFATVFIPAGAARDAENAEIPSDDVANYSSLIPDTLTTTDTDGTGNTIAGRANLLTALGLTALPNGAPLLLPGTLANTDKNLLREALLPDVLRLNVTQPYGTLGIASGGLQNGRVLDYPTVDVPLQLLRQLADVQFPSGVTGGGPLGTRVALNCVAFPACADRRVLVVVQGTQFVKTDSNVTNYTTESNDLPFLSTFPYIAAPHPLPGDPGTVNYPVQSVIKGTGGSAQ